MSRSIHKIVECKIAKKLKDRQRMQEKELHTQSLQKNDYRDLLLSLLDREFVRLLDVGSKFESLYVPNTLEFNSFSSEFYEAIKELGFIFRGRSRQAGCIVTELIIPNYKMCSKGNKLTVAQKQLRTFNSALKKKQKEIARNTRFLCVELCQKLKDGDFILGNDGLTISVFSTYLKHEGISYYEARLIVDFFMRRKIEFISCPNLGEYQFRLL